MNNKICYLYHFRLIGNTDLSDGYIGVASDISKRKYKHINTPVNSITKEIIDSMVPIEFVILLQSTREYCLSVEKLLRPSTNIGWNVISGGKNSTFPSNIKDIMSKNKIGNSNVGSGEDHHFHGKIGKDAVRYGTRGAKNPNHIGHWVTPLGAFESMSLAADAIGVPKSTIFYRCVTSNNFYDWYFKEIEA